MASADRSSEQARMTLENIKSGILARKNTDRRVDSNKIHTLLTAEKFDERTATTNFADKPQNRVLKILYKLPLKWRKKLAMGLFAFLTCLVVFFLNGLTSAYQPLGARWLDFRAFLSRSFELSHSELDDIFNEALKMPADPKQIITPQHADQIETTLKSIFQKPDLSIFPNPFFETPVRGTYVAGHPVNLRFADIPPSHPFYTALEPLLELGINFADKQNRVRPYEPITWKDWQNSVDDLFKLLMIDPDLSAEVATQRQGYMNNIDVRNCIEHLREKLFIKSNKQLVWSQEVFYPGRLEAFAVLSSVVKELNTNE
ncbi:MAG: S-layer homology domain-containing protein [Candidatus Riflebacteria bacterium]|nr:S-layer homology domain-containing protein [Candidatus Riflebacteria bacterium]